MRFLLPLLFLGCTEIKPPNYDRGLVKPNFKSICKTIGNSHGLKYQVLLNQCYITFESGSHAIIFHESEAYVAFAAHFMKHNVTKRDELEVCLAAKGCSRGRVTGRITCHRACAILVDYKLFY